MFGILILFYFLGALLANEINDLQRISVFGKATGSVLELGHIEYNKANSKALYLPSRVDSIDGRICVGTKDVANSDCFIVTDNISDKQFVLNVRDGEIDYLSMVPATEDNHKVIVRSVRKAPQPNLKPNNIDRKTKPQTTSSNPEEPNQEPEVEKSFVQKYWTYIVPGLLIVFVLLGEEKK